MPVHWGLCRVNCACFTKPCMTEMIGFIYQCNSLVDHDRS